MLHSFRIHLPHIYMEFRKMVMITLYAKQETQMYRTDFWTLWEKARVGCFERTACILSIVKQITSPGGMHETSAWAWCTGKTQRNRVEKKVGGGSGWGIHVNPWLIHVNIWQKPLQYCKVISLQLIKINGKKKKKNPPANAGDTSLIPGLGHPTRYRATKLKHHNQWSP